MFQLLSIKKITKYIIQNTYPSYQHHLYKFLKFFKEVIIKHRLFLNFEF